MTKLTKHSKIVSVAMHPNHLHMLARTFMWNPLIDQITLRPLGTDNFRCGQCYHAMFRFSAVFIY